MNTSGKGNKLRDAVFQLLKAAQKDNCSIEKSLFGKKCDVYFEENDRWGKLIRHAIECKSFGKQLTRSDFDEIFSTYNPVKASFDVLIIITDQQSTTGVSETLSHVDWIKHFTFDQFSDWLMDFSRYQQAQKAMFEHEGLSSYYVPIKDKAGNDIESRIDEWVRSDSSRPQAILAGYGMGKTSFAKRLASKYSTKNLAGDIGRIPILIRLGDIFNEQSLEGLVCKYFASQYPVKNFIYPLFLELNRNGRFLIILDGFDEMKHAMSFRDFKANFSELNQLVVAGSKVIILGRPNAFMSEDEKACVLHGTEKMGEITYNSIAMKDYEEIEVAPFDEDQLIQYVPQYISYVRSQQSTRPCSIYTDEFCRKRINDVLDPAYRELISRPVHAHMLITIAMSTEEQLNRFSRYHLYNVFIEKFLEREDQKSARKPIGSDARKDFIITAAWHGWIKGGSAGFDLDSLNDVRLNYDVNYQSRSSIIRELITGSIIERKGEKYFYFSHRSFQEFLVAEFLIAGDWQAKDLKMISNALNQEIIAFINESGRNQDVYVRVSESLCVYNGPLSNRLLDFMVENISDEDRVKIADNIESQSPWHVLIYAVSEPQEILDKNKLYNEYEKLLTKDTKIAFILGVLLHYIRGDLKRDPSIGKFILGVLHFENIALIRKCQTQGYTERNTVGIDNESQKNWIYLLVECIQPGFENNGELDEFAINIPKLAISLTNVLLPRYQLEDTRVPKSTFRFPANVVDSYLARAHSSLSSIDCERMVRSEKAMILSFWRSNPTMDRFATVQRKDNSTLRR